MLTLDQRCSFERLMTEHTQAELAVRQATERKHRAMHACFDFVNTHTSEAISELATSETTFGGAINLKHSTGIDIPTKVLEQFAAFPEPEPPPLVTISGLDTLTDAPDPPPNGTFCPTAGCIHYAGHKGDCDQG